MPTRSSKKSAATSDSTTATAPEIDTETAGVAVMDRPPAARPEKLVMDGDAFERLMEMCGSSIPMTPEQRFRRAEMKCQMIARWLLQEDAAGRHFDDAKLAAALTGTGWSDQKKTWVAKRALAVVEFRERVSTEQQREELFKAQEAAAAKVTKAREELKRVVAPLQAAVQQAECQQQHADADIAAMRRAMEDLTRETKDDITATVGVLKHQYREQLHAFATAENEIASIDKICAFTDAEAATWITSSSHPRFRAANSFHGTGGASFGQWKEHKTELAERREELEAQLAVLQPAIDDFEARKRAIRHFFLTGELMNVEDALTMISEEREAEASEAPTAAGTSNKPAWKEAGQLYDTSGLYGKRGPNPNAGASPATEDHR